MSTLSPHTPTGRCKTQKQNVAYEFFMKIHEWYTVVEITKKICFALYRYHEGYQNEWL